MLATVAERTYSSRSDSSCSLRLEMVLWSKTFLRFAMTVTTQLTLDKLDSLDGQCHSFGGPLSAAVHLSLVQPGYHGHLTDTNQQLLTAAVKRTTDVFNRCGT